MKKALDDLRRDYLDVTGQPFAHFFCPILFRDEAVELCAGHVVNEAFPASDRTRVPQRADVDAFWGAHFEADFVNLQHKGRHRPVDVVADKALSKKLRPRLISDGQPVDYYHAGDNPMPANHSELTLHTGHSDVRLGLKLEVSDMLARDPRGWNFIIEQDLRLSALASLLKAAHLSLFAKIGYTYALSAGGHFLGYSVLGRFFEIASDTGDVLSLAADHFFEFRNLVRPIDSAPEGLEGTVTDGKFLFCLHQDRPFGFLVIVRTGVHRHAVVVPAIDDAESAARFVSFMNDPDESITTRLARFDRSRMEWHVSPETTRVAWPRVAFELPLADGPSST